MSENSCKKQGKKQKKKKVQQKEREDRLIQSDKNNEEEKRDGESLCAEQTRCSDGQEEEVENDHFEMELCWCIEQLELGLKNKKPTKDQTEKAFKLIKVLRSEKASKVKKRQIMRTTFGDYRKKIASEAKRYASKARLEPKIVATAAAPDKHKGSLFIKPKSLKDGMPAADETLDSGEWRFKTSENTFQFSFLLPE